MFPMFGHTVKFKAPGMLFFRRLHRVEKAYIGGTQMTDHNGLQVVPEDGKLNPLLILEQRPSRITGIAFWLVLSYRDFHEERILPEGFMGWDEASRDLAIAKLAAEMRQKLRPILEAEDAPLLVSP
jgi:hypothetical protein